MKNLLPYLLGILFFLNLNQVYGRSEEDSLLNLARQTKSDTCKATLFIALSRLEMKADQSKSIRYAEQALQYAKSGNEPHSLVRACNQLGIVLNYIANYASALEYHLKAIEIAERNKFSQELALSNNLAGGVFYNEEDYDHAAVYFKRALEIRETLDDKKAIAGSLNNVAEIYRLKGDNETALGYFNKAIKINEEEKSKIYLAINYNNVGNIYLEEHKLPEAFENLDKSVKYARESCDLEAISQSLNSMGAWYLQAGKTKEAIESFQEALKTSRLITQRTEEANALKGLSDANYTLKFYKEALDYYRLYKEKKDSLVNLEKNKKIHEILLRSETEKNENQIRRLEQEQNIQTLKTSRQRLIILLLVVLIILILASAVFLYTRSQMKNRLAEELEGRVEERTQQLTEANKRMEEFSYVTIHDLRSPLANMQALLNRLDKKNTGNPDNRELLEKIQSSVTGMSTTLNDLTNVLQQRQNLDDSRELVLFKRIAAEIEDNIAWQIRESRARIVTQFLHAPSIHYPVTHVRSILLNLLTNAIKYRSPDRELMIRIKTEQTPDGMICLSVEDNGLGFDIETQGRNLFKLFGRLHTHVEGKGIGLYIVHSMVTGLGGRIEVKSQPGKGSTFSVFLKDSTK